MSSRRSLVLLCFVLLAVSAWPGALVSAQSDLPAVELRPNDCEFLVWGADDPRPQLGEIACGTLDVPENWSEPEGRSPCACEALMVRLCLPSTHW